MGQHKNYNPQHVKGFRPGKAPAVVQRDVRVAYTMGYNADLGQVILEWDAPIKDLRMTPAEVDQWCANLQGAKAALEEAMKKKPQP